MPNQEEIDTTVAFCAGCGSVIPDHMAEKDIFLQQGDTGVCPFCGGPMIVVDSSDVERLREARVRGQIV